MIVAPVWLTNALPKSSVKETLNSAAVGVVGSSTPSLTFTMFTFSLVASSSIFTTFTESFSAVKLASEFPSAMNLTYVLSFLKKLSSTPVMVMVCS